MPSSPSKRLFQSVPLITANTGVDSLSSGPHARARTILTASVTGLLREAIERGARSAVRDGIFHLVAAAQLDAGAPPRLVRRPPAREQMMDVDVEMRLELAREVALGPAAIEQSWKPHMACMG